MTDYFYTYIIQEIFLSLPAELGPSTNNPYLLSMQEITVPETRFRRCQCDFERIVRNQEEHTSGHEAGPHQCGLASAKNIVPYFADASVNVL